MKKGCSTTRKPVATLKILKEMGFQSTEKGGGRDLRVFQHLSRMGGLTGPNH
jgi:hypothetical protein